MLGRSALRSVSAASRHWACSCSAPSSSSSSSSRTLSPCSSSYSSSSFATPSSSSPPLHLYRIAPGLSFDPSHLVVLPEFVSEGEEQALLAEVDLPLRKLRYDAHHWDNAIRFYRELHKSKWTPTSSAILARVRQLPCFSEEQVQLSSVAHVLDLEAVRGEVLPHVDSLDYVGKTVSGISLLSPSIMRLQHVQSSLVVDVLLPTRSLYIMRRSARYDYSHAVLGGPSLEWQGRVLPRDRRIAFLFRDPPPASSSPAPPSTSV